MFKWFTDFLERRGRLKILRERHSTEEYMRRYYLWHNSQNVDDNHKAKPTSNLFLHNFRASDIPYFHDHPWPWMTIILKGGYWEHTAEYVFNGKCFELVTKKLWRGPGTILKKKATDLHWIELPENHNNNTWTLFFHWKRERKWGFLDMSKTEVPVTARWTYYREFLGLK